jgi:REP element-mobilizing transposase RayT
MARPMGIQSGEALYHVTSTGKGKRPILKDAKDQGILLNMLEQVTDRYYWFRHAYCLMTNHYHLVIETPDGNLSKGMRHLNGVYSIRFNRRHTGVGHVSQGKRAFGSRKSGKRIRLKGDNASLSLLDATDAEALTSLSIENQQFSMQAIFHALWKR